jgi:alpha-L-fucosidase
MTTRTRRYPLLVTAVLATLGAAVLVATAPPAAAAPTPGYNFSPDDSFSAERTRWWRDGRFGMFIHFGTYSHLEGEYQRPDGTICRNAEWIQLRCGIPWPEYEQFARQFNPSSFSAAAIVRAAKDAGQRYIVITAKHHDGYAMWPTAQNSWDLRDHSSFDRSRDILAELAAESRAQGVRLGLYYSIWDWHDPDARSTTNFGRYRTRMFNQLTELVRNYDPALLWFDGDWPTSNPPNPWTRRDGEDLEQHLRTLKPSLLINNRISMRSGDASTRRVVDGDFGTPEQSIPSAPVIGQPWESCMTINGHWGYARYDTNWKSATTLSRNLLDIAGRGGNYLLNVGPDRLGRIPTPSVDRLRAMGSWLNSNGQGAAVYSAGHTGLVADPSWGAISRAGDKLYASVYSWPAAGTALHLQRLRSFQVTGARVLGSTQSVSVTASGDGFDIRPSGAATNAVATVIELTIQPPPTQPVGTGTGLTADYFANATFSGTPAFRRTDPTVNFAWKYSGSPASSLATDNFSARWNGFIQPRFTETYTLTVFSDDTVRLWIDGQLVLDATTPHALRIDRVTVALVGGRRHAIRIEHSERTGEAYLKLQWSSPSQGQQIVPRSQLYPA